MRTRTLWHAGRAPGRSLVPRQRRPDVVDRPPPRRRPRIQQPGVEARVGVRLVLRQHRDARARAVVALMALPALAHGARLRLQWLFLREPLAHPRQADAALGDEDGRRLALRVARPPPAEDLAEPLRIRRVPAALEIVVVVMGPRLPRPDRKSVV